jgi:hypothetical protein
MLRAAINPAIYRPTRAAPASDCSDDTLPACPATTPGEGQVSGQGEITLRDGVGTELKIQARGAIIIDTDLVTTIDSDLAITGNPQARLKLGGKVKVLKADSRLELTRFAPFSYFWPCWMVSPSASATASWLMQDAPQPTMVPNMNIDRIGKALAGRAAEDLRGRLSMRSFTDCLSS